METRKESLGALKVCRFCLTQNEPLIALYEKNKAPQSVVTLSTKILTCIGVEIFPSDKMPQHICNKCKFFMELFYGFKHVCRKSDKNILHFIQHGTPLEPLNWAALLNKVYRLHTKSEFGSVKTVTQDGATVKVTAEELSDSGEEGDDDNVYSVKIEDGSDETKSIKVITSVDNQQSKGNKKGFANMTKLAKHLRTHAGERAYPCKHCDKSFIKSHHYTRHRRLKHMDLIRTPSDSIVEPELSYRCEECEEVFSSQDELIYHSALHATRSLTCPLCQEKFDDVDTVTSHIKSHVNGAEYMCDFCELIFTTQDKLDMHIASSHEMDMNDKEITQTEEEDGESMEEGYEDDSSINVKEEDGHMVVEIKKAGEYMLAEPEAMEDDDDEAENDPSEDLEITLDASGPLLASKPAKADDSAPQPPKPVKEVSSVLAAVKRSMGSSNIKNISVIVNANNTTASKPEEQKIEELPIIRKVDYKGKVIQRQSSPLSNNTDKKEKTNSRVESAKVENSSAAGASDLSLRLLEKELQDLQRTNTRNEVSKTPAKPMETPRNKRSQLHTSTPKPRAAEKKEAATPKSAPEKPVQEKRLPGRPPKENKEVKNASVREEKEAKEKANASIKEDKETKELKETQVIRNVPEDNTSTEEPVRRSTRPGKVKDYAKMIRDSPDDDEETSEEELEEEELKETEVRKSVETPRRGRKPKAAPAAPTTPASAPRKRGRPRRKEPSPVPPKIVKKMNDESEDEDDPEANSSTTKPEESKCKDTAPAAEVNTSEEPRAPVVPAPADPASNVIVSPSGQTLKKVPIKALPPGVKPMPLPRKLPSVTEMQIGKKMVKVQKIVMTKAEVEAMTKKGLVEMKDGTIVLKQGIKLPASTALKSPGSSQEKREILPPRPTRCDLDNNQV